MRGLEGATAIVTGGSTLIGQAVVRALAGRGVRVAIADIDAEPGAGARGRARRRRALLGDRHPRRRAVAAFVAATVERFGGIDFLVNLACSYVDDGSASPRADWLESLNVNVVSAAMLAEAVRPQLAASSRGAIVNFTLDLGEGRADRALAVPGRQGRARAADAQHGDGLRRRRHPRQLGLAGLDVVEGDGRAVRRRSREDRSRRRALPPARPRRQPGGGRGGRRRSCAARTPRSSPAPTTPSTAATPRWAPSRPCPPSPNSWTEVVACQAS